MTGPSTLSRTARALRSSGAAINNAPRFQDLPDRHRDRASGYVLQGGEPAFAELLLAAGFIEVDYQIALSVSKSAGDH